MDTPIDYTRGAPGITISDSNVGYKPRVVRILTGFGSGVMFGVHNNSMINLARGVVERVLFLSTSKGLQPCPKPSPSAFTRLSGFKTRLLKHLFSTPIVAREDYPSLYTGRKRDVYQKAFESLLVSPIQRKDSYVSTFVKAEKINFTAKEDPAPRVIQPRSPRFNLEVGRYLKLFEKELCRGFRRMFGYEVILKGLNADGVAGCLRDNWLNYKDPVAVGLDASRFDQHVSKEALQFEHSVYNSVFKSKELANLLRMQIDNVGFGRIGESLLKYKVTGCRMSGDINTGMGNCLIMSSLVLHFLDEVNCDARLSNNGDDCVLILERRDLYKLSNITQYFLEFGFNLKREATVEVFEQIEFCQAQPVLVGESYRMCRNIHTAMSKDCVSLLGWEKAEQFETWRSAIGICGAELTSGVPVWQEFYKKLRGRTNRVGGVERIYDCGMGSMARGVKQVEGISAETRFSFYLAFGVLPDAQIALENEMPDVEYDESMPLVTLQQSIATSFNTQCLNVINRTNVEPSTP